MHALRQRRALPRHLAWLLWLALLLPIAQVGASWHALSHATVELSNAGSPTSSDDDRRASHATHCDLCLTAAAVTGGAPLADAPPIALLVARFERVTAAAAPSWFAPAPRAYRSRAPPFAPR